jgi:pimeloyl-ACP methyl ester carboxylesterase
MPFAQEIAICRWLTDAELTVYASTGFQGGLQWYQCTFGGGKYSAELETFSGRTIDVPICFISGKSDWGVYQAPGALERMETSACTQWRGTYLIDDAGHWVQQEQPKEVMPILLRCVRG